MPEVLPEVPVPELVQELPEAREQVQELVLPEAFVSEEQVQAVVPVPVD